MKKFSLLLGTLGGAMAGYLLSNDKLREQLANAKDPEHAAKVLGQHLAKDGKKLGSEVKKFAESDQVKKNMKQFKSYASDKWTEAQKGLKEIVKKGTDSVTGKKGAAKGKKPGMKTKDV